VAQYLSRTLEPVIHIELMQMLQQINGQRLTKYQFGRELQRGVGKGANGHLKVVKV
jgi:hypothetical protein